MLRPLASVCAFAGLLACRTAESEDELGDGIGSEESTSESSSSESSSTTTEDESDVTETSHPCGMNWDLVHPRPNLVFLLETSTSMATGAWDHDSDALTDPITRWSGVRGALEVALTEPEVALAVGGQRAPSSGACPNAVPGQPNCYDETACLVANVPEVAIAPLESSTLFDALPSVDADDVELAGAAPLSAAFASARDHLLEQADGAKVVVLITDGAPNCAADSPVPDALETYDPGLVAALADAHTRDGISTFVVGVDVLDELSGTAPNDAEPAINPFTVLEELAVAGGVPNPDGPSFYLAVDQPALLDHLTSGFVSLRDCTIDLGELPEGLPSPELIFAFEVENSGIVVPYVADCATEDGWSWVREGVELELCGSYCREFGAGTSYDASTGCWGE